MKYLDSGQRHPDQTLYTWLSGRFVTAAYFGCQTGYFSADGLYPFETALKAMLAGGGEAHFVLGANEASLGRSDVEYLLGVLEPHSAQTSVTIVNAPDVLMHSKVFYFEGQDGSRAALVGSCNLTRGGLASNVEAALSLSSVYDPTAPFGEIKDGIEAWRSKARRNGMTIKSQDLDRLVAARVLDRPAPARPRLPNRVKRRMRQLFPGMGPVVKVPRRPTTTAPRKQVASIRLGSATPLPAGNAGIVKRLSKEDTKGFRGESGTPYVALPTLLLPYLPTRPYGKNDEPRLDIEIEAAVDAAPQLVVYSGSASTNITGVGFGKVKRSHRDLRLNILKVIVDGITYAAHQVGARVPSAGDPLTIEFLPGNTLRLTFVAKEPRRTELLGLCTESRGSWGWLPS